MPYDVYIVDKNGSNEGERQFGKEARSVNVIDLPLWEVKLAANSTFDTDGILRDRNNHCYMYTSEGWECSASVDFNTDNCKINESKYNEFSWEYSYTDNRGAKYVVTRDGYPMGSGGSSGLDSIWQGIIHDAQPTWRRILRGSAARYCPPTNGTHHHNSTTYASREWREDFFVVNICQYVNFAFYICIVFEYQQRKMNPKTKEP